jgi:hypothetical protein
MLEIFDMRINSEGYICKGKKKVKAIDGGYVRIDEFAGITKGKKKGEVVVWRNDITSLIRLSDEIC